MLARAVSWSVAYFATVFAIGFILGVLRVGLVEAQLGTRWAELAEMPIVLLAIVLCARWIVAKTQDNLSRVSYLLIGLNALALLLIAESMLVIFLRKISISEYVAGRDPVSGSAYLVSLALFAIMPLVISRCWHPTKRNSKAKPRKAPRHRTLMWSLVSQSNTFSDQRKLMKFESTTDTPDSNDLQKMPNHVDTNSRKSEFIETVT